MKVVTVLQRKMYYQCWQWDFSKTKLLTSATIWHRFILLLSGLFSDTGCIIFNSHTQPFFGKGKTVWTGTMKSSMMTDSGLCLVSKGNQTTIVALKHLLHPWCIFSSLLLKHEDLCCFRALLLESILSYRSLSGNHEDNSCLRLPKTLDYPVWWLSEKDWPQQAVRQWNGIVHPVSFQIKRLHLNLPTSETLPVR